MTDSFNEYQKAARSTGIYKNELYPVLGLAEEAGEVAGKIAKYIRDETDYPYEAVKKELGDVLWMVACIAYDRGMLLSEVAELNLQKLADRKQRGVLSGSGDNR